MNKDNYTRPEIEIIEFTLVDILTASETYDPTGILGEETKADSWWTEE